MIVYCLQTVPGTVQLYVCLLSCKSMSLAFAHLKAHCSMWIKCDQRCAGETPLGGPKLARTPIGTPRQAQPSSSKLDASPAHVPHTSAKGWAQAPAVGARSEARTGRQLARTPIGLASANKPALLASHMADPQGTPGGLLQMSHTVLLCTQEDMLYKTAVLWCMIRSQQLPVLCPNHA